MKLHKILQETDEPNVLRVVDEDKDYEKLYHRINKDKYMEDNKVLMIVSVEYIYGIENP
jgi:hypothetical protein